MKKRYFVLSLLVLLSMVFTACAPGTPQVIEKEVVVEKPVIQTVVVEKEVAIPQTVVVEKEIEKEIVKTVVVEKVVEATPQSGGTMTWSRAEPCEGNCTNFNLASGDYVGWYAQNPAFLTACNETGAECNEPGLALRWEESDDHLTWTYYLREDVRWSDGTLSTADDHIFTINAITHPDFAAAVFQAAFKDVKGMQDYQDGTTDTLAGIEKVDDFTFRVLWDVAKRRTPYEISAYKLMPYHLMKDQTVEEWKDMGSVRHTVGPYYFTDIVYDQYYAMKANPYFYLGKPRIDEFIYRAIPNWAVAVAGLKSGEIDVVDVTPLDEIQGLRQVDTLNIIPDAVARGYMFWFNMRDEYALPVKVRQAMSLALDRQAIIDTLWEGYGWTFPCHAQPLDVPLAGIIPDANEYDPERARALVEEALAEGWDGKGWNGDTLKLQFYYTTEFTKNLMAAVAAMWQDVGIQVDVELLPTDKVVEVFYDKGEYDVLYGCCADPGTLPHFDLQALYNSACKYPNGFCGQGIADPELDVMLEKVMSFDRQEEIAGVQEACTWLIDNMATMTTWMSPGLWTANTRLRGTVSPDGMFVEYTHTWWIEE